MTNLFYNDYVQVNKYSRPATKLQAVKGLVLHYTANPNASAENHQNYFDGADGGGSRYAGAHIFVDRDSAVCIVPLNEVAYHANDRQGSKIAKLGRNANLTTIGIEMCVEADGSLHPDTEERTRLIVNLLMSQYGLKKTDVYRHYDVTGKNCPAFWVAAPAKWYAFQNSLTGVAEAGEIKASTAPAKATQVTGYRSGQVGVVEVIADTLELWEQPDFHSEVVGTVKRGTKWRVYDTFNGLYRVGMQQWITADTAQTNFTHHIGILTITAAELNVRADASLTAPVLKALPKGSTWKVYSEVNGMLAVGTGQWVSANPNYSTFKAV